MPRLFIGLELPAAQQQALLALAEPGPGLRWQSAAQLHLTLRFIGELPDAQAEQLTEALHRLQASAFSVQVAGVGYFGSPQRPSILWAGVVAPAPLQALREQIDLLISPWRAADPQRFVPHVTLARCGPECGSLQPFLQAQRGLLLAPWQVTALCLFASAAGPGGSRYSVLARYPLESK
ncbi:RNA 2',3'-cyclic phosphodiesterase [Halopseudomonas pachastrellae]|uniref:RNA 2',3'-cyclic phosphodiesterase n=1 Tax=Halopseudomonas pachastrellae TaxID=254161 RepID=UPI003D7DA94B